MSDGFEKWGPDLTPEQQERLDFLITGFVSIYHPMDAWLLMRVLREREAEIARLNDELDDSRELIAALTNDYSDWVMPQPESTTTVKVRFVNAGPGSPRPYPIDFDDEEEMP